MSEYVYAGLASQTIDIFLQDSSSSTGQGLAGLVYNSAGLVASYRKGATGSRTAITLATQTVGGAFSSGGFVEIDATNMKGVYRLDIPNAAVDTEGFVTLYLYGATNLLPTALRIDCRPLPVDVKKLLGTAWLTPGTAGTPDVNVKLWNALTTVALPLVPTTAGRTLDVSAGGEAGIDWANVGSPTTTLGLTGTTISSTQIAASVTGAVGSVTGLTASNLDVASSTLATAANLAIVAGYLDTEIAAIKTKTDQLTFTTANKVDSTAVLDSAVGTQITAIETFATRMTTGLVQDGAVYQFTANMLELGPSGGGGSSVNVLPATGIVSDRSAGTTLLPVVGETISQSITVYQSDGTTAVSLSGKTLKVIFETMSGVDVAVVAAADITISGASSNVVTFAYPSAVTASERTLRFAIRDAAAPLTMYLQGVCSVVAAPKVDA